MSTKIIYKPKDTNYVGYRFFDREGKSTMFHKMFWVFGPREDIKKVEHAMELIKYAYDNYNNYDGEDDDPNDAYFAPDGFDSMWDEAMREIYAWPTTVIITDKVPAYDEKYNEYYLEKRNGDYLYNSFGNHEAYNEIIHEGKKYLIELIDEIEVS